MTDRLAAVGSGSVLDGLEFQNIANVGRVPRLGVPGRNSSAVQTIGNALERLNASGFDFFNNGKHLGGEFGLGCSVRRHHSGHGLFGIGGAKFRARPQARTDCLALLAVSVPPLGKRTDFTV